MWTARLDAERSLQRLIAVSLKSQSQEAAAREELIEVWAEARNDATGDEEDVVGVWLWGLPSGASGAEDVRKQSAAWDVGSNRATSSTSSSGIGLEDDRLREVFDVSTSFTGISRFIPFSDRSRSSIFPSIYPRICLRLIIARSPHSHSYIFHPAHGSGWA